MFHHNKHHLIVQAKSKESILSYEFLEFLPVHSTVLRDNLLGTRRKGRAPLAVTLYQVGNYVKLL